jgi:oxygen-independent coproporphyrinogen-3 oxidase
MYALPTQTLESWRSSLLELLSLSEETGVIKHISAYSLDLAVNSPLYARFPKDSALYPQDELYCQMYDSLIEMTKSFGFEQYEVSNFAKPGYRSKHNLSYWLGGSYLAFGVGAHRYVNGIRSSNFRSLARYMKDPLGLASNELIDHQTRVKEGIMLGLRLTQGIDLEQFQAIHGLDLASHCADKIESLTLAGFLSLDGKMLSLTQKGIPVSNSVIAELF